MSKNGEIYTAGKIFFFLIRSLFNKKGVLIGSLSQSLGVLTSFGGSAMYIEQWMLLIKTEVVFSRISG